MSGSISHDPPRPHRAGPVPGAVRRLPRIRVGDAGGRARSRRLDAAAHRLARHRVARADDRQLRRARPMGRGAAGRHLHSGPYRGRQARAGRDQVTDARRSIDAPWLDEPPLAGLLAVLDRDGEEARIVGGAVRNALLGEPHGDIDIATTALPQDVMRRVEAAGFKGVPTGIEHGTVTVVAAGRPYEVTTLREDVETFGRHAKVAFGRDWKRDAERRDFTMNALSASRDGTVHDYVGGIADIAARRVRFIGDAARRIAEDYLRILRFFRFHAAYGEGLPDRAGLDACIRARDGLDRLSRERVRMELVKLLVAPHVVPTLATMTEAGLLEQVVGGVPLLASFANMVKLEAVLAFPAQAVRRLGALAVAVTEDAERLRERLRLANAEYERLASMADGWWHLSRELGEKGGRALL